MSGYTSKLNLFVYNPVTDGALTFNITQALTNNFIAIDSYADYLDTHKLDIAGGTMSGTLKVDDDTNKESIIIDVPYDDYRDFAFYNNTERLGFIRTKYDLQNSRKELQFYLQPSPSDNPIRILSMSCDFQGNYSLYGITPSLSDDSTQLATTHYTQLVAYGPVYNSNAVIVSNMSMGATTEDNDKSLRSYLPADSTTQKYEVYISINGTAGNSVDDKIKLQITSGLIAGYLECGQAKTTVNNKPDVCSWAGWVPIDTDARLTIRRESSWNGTATFEAKAYRRIR